MKKNRVLQYVVLLLTITTMGSMKIKKPLKYLPLGDSYTICTGAGRTESWPYLLTQHLNQDHIETVLSDNPARNGYSTQNLIDYELPLVKSVKPDLVTILIGVNDWVRNVNSETFEKNLVFILDEVQKSMTSKQNILLITIPDFGVTPVGKNYGGGRDISEGISGFNKIIVKHAAKRNLKVCDIFPLSKKMALDPSLVAKDGLHPSAKEYAEWEKEIYKEVRNILK